MNLDTKHHKTCLLINLRGNSSMRDGEQSPDESVNVKISIRRRMLEKYYQEKMKVEHTIFINLVVSIAA